MMQRRAVAAGGGARRRGRAPFVTATVVRAQRPDERRSRQRRPRARRRQHRGLRRRHLRRAQRARVRAARRSRAARPCCFGSCRSRTSGRRGDEVARGRAPSRSRTRACPAARSRSSSSRCCPRRGCSSPATRRSRAALAALGAELGLDVVARRTSGGTLEPHAGDLALVVAAHGRDELATLRAGLEAGCPYVGLVASPQARRRACSRSCAPTAWRRSCSTGSTHRPGSTSAPARPPRSRCRSWPGSSRWRGAAHRREAEPRRHRRRPDLRHDGRRGRDTPSLEHDGETLYFCCDGCRAARSRHAAHERRTSRARRGESPTSYPTSRRSPSGSRAWTTSLTRASPRRCS